MHGMAWTLFRLFVCLFISDYYFITRWLWKWFHTHKIHRKYLMFCLVMVFGVDLYSTLLVECSTLFNVTKWLNDTKKEWNIIFRQDVWHWWFKCKLFGAVRIIIDHSINRWMSLCCYCFHAVFKTNKNMKKIKSFICSGRFG